MVKQRILNFEKLEKEKSSPQNNPPSPQINTSTNEKIANPFAAFCNSKSNNLINSQNKMIFDSGCSGHVCNNKNFFTTFKSTNAKSEVINNSNMDVEGYGTVPVKFKSTSGKTIHFNLYNVAYSPTSTYNLFSAGTALQYGHTSQFNGNNNNYFIPKNGMEKIQLYTNNNIFFINLEFTEDKSTQSANFPNTSFSGDSSTQHFDSIFKGKDANRSNSINSDQAKNRIPSYLEIAKSKHSQISG